MVFTSTRRIDFALVDQAKIVYYPQFWDLAHRFYEESWEYSCGMHYNSILNEKNIAFPLVHSQAKFHHPLSYGDIVTCQISIIKIGNTSITWKYEFRNQEDIVCWTAEQVTVCTKMSNPTSKISVPDWMRNSLSKMM
jgi:4-hydroxybenzoyl-CoA thioesterase